MIPKGWHYIAVKNQQHFKEKYCQNMMEIFIV